MNELKVDSNSKRRKTSLLDGIFQFIAFGLVILGLGLVICVFNSQPIDTTSPAKPPPALPKQIQPKVITVTPTTKDQNDIIKDYWTIFGTKGDFTAGVGGTMFALAGFIYLFLSFKKQQESNIVQIASFKHDKIESRFFELIKLHRDNVSELSYTYYTRPPIIKDETPLKDAEKETVTHRKIFQAIKFQFSSAAEELSFLFDDVNRMEVYEDSYEKILIANATLKKRKIDLDNFAKVDILYLIIFFGVGKDGSETILSMTTNKYKREFIEKVISYAALKPKVQSHYWVQWATINLMDSKHAKFQSILTKRNNPKSPTPGDINLSWQKNKSEPFKTYYPDNYEKYYGGHQFRIGHYFRNLYQTVSFINEQPDLSGVEQQSYIRHLRGQLSTDEQIVFFLNSLSQLGRIWELEDKKSGNAIERKFQLISDYGLIKNIPNNQVITGLKLTDFYPDVNYEGFSLANK